MLPSGTLGLHLVHWVCICYTGFASGTPGFADVVTDFRQILKKPGIPPKSLAQILQTLEESALQNMQDFGAQQIANTLHIMAKQPEEIL